MRRSPEPARRRSHQWNGLAQFGPSYAAQGQPAVGVSGRMGSHP